MHPNLGYSFQDKPKFGGKSTRRLACYERGPCLVRGKIKAKR